MEDRTEVQRDNTKITFTKCYKGQEIGASYDPQSPEGKRHIRKIVLVERNCRILLYFCALLDMLFNGTLLR